MNAKYGKDRKGLLRVDNAANAVVIGAGLLIVLYAVATGEPGQAPAPQVAQQVPIGRLVVTAERPKAEKENLAARTEGRWDSAQVAVSRPESGFVAVGTHFR